MVTESSRPKGVKSKMRKPKLRTYLNWKEALKQKKERKKRAYNKGWNTITSLLSYSTFNIIDPALFIFPSLNF